MSSFPIHYDVINALFSLYISREYSYKDSFHAKVREEGFCLSNREIDLIWQAFDRAAQEWQGRNNAPISVGIDRLYKYDPDN